MNTKPIRDPRKALVEVENLLKRLVRSTDDPKVRKEAEAELRDYQRVRKHISA